MTEAATTGPIIDTRLFGVSLNTTEAEQAAWESGLPPMQTLVLVAIASGCTDDAEDIAAKTRLSVYVAEAIMTTLEAEGILVR